jgi:hypothetical protein
MLLRGISPECTTEAFELTFFRRAHPLHRRSLSTDTRKWTLYDIKNWTLSLQLIAPRFVAGVACPGSA